MNRVGKVEVLCLGTGHHISALYDGVASASNAILIDGYPVLLVGTGVGTIRACNHYLHMVPDTILLLNESPSQCAELSAIVAAETARGRHLRIFAEESICMAVAEILRRDVRDDSCQGVQPANTSLIRLTLNTEPVPIAQDLTLLMHPNSYRRDCAAISAIFYYKELPILSLTGPTAFDTSLFAKLCNVPYVMVWVAPTTSTAVAGPTSSSSEKRSTLAAASEVALFAEKVNGSRPTEERVVFLLTGFGGPKESPMMAGYVSPMSIGVPVVLLAGDVVNSSYGPLHLPLTNVRKAKPSQPHHNEVTPEKRGVGAGGGSPAPYQQGPLGGRVAAVATLSSSAQHQQQHSVSPPGSKGTGSLQQTGISKWDPKRGKHGVGSGTTTSDQQTSFAQHVDVTSGLSNSLDTSHQQYFYKQQHQPPQPQGSSVGPTGSFSGAALALGSSAGGMGGEGMKMMEGIDSEGTSDLRRGNRRVFIFNNEDKGLPGRLLMLNRCRTLEQLHSLASELTKLKPIKELLFANGRPVHSLAEIPDKCELIVIRRGGIGYEPRDLPRLMRTKVVSR